MQIHEQTLHQMLLVITREYYYIAQKREYTTKVETLPHLAASYEDRAVSLAQWSGGPGVRAIAADAGGGPS